MKRFILFSTFFLATTFAFSDDLPKITVELGKSVEQTSGFFDLGKVSYPDKSKTIVIDDKTYPDKIAKRKAFTNAIASGDVKKSNITETPVVILLSGTVDLSDGKISDDDHSYFDKFDSTTHKRINGDIVYNIGSNKTILGIENARIAYGGLKFKATADNKAENLIIRNVEFWDAHGSTEYDTKVGEYKDKKASADQLAIEGTENSSKSYYDYVPKNIWIDHCSFSDGKCSDLERNYNHDGALDVKCVKNMTISYCEFTNHDKVSLIGPGDKFTRADERQITFHHNYYHDAIQRMPRSRGCQIHLYNNVYDRIGNKGNSGYSLGPGIASLYIIESNVFGTHQNMILRYNDKSSPTDSTLSKFYATGNIPELNSNNSEEYNKHKVDSKPFEIPYKYDLKDAKTGEKETLTLAGNVIKIEVK